MALKSKAECVLSTRSTDLDTIGRSLRARSVPLAPERMLLHLLATTTPTAKAVSLRRVEARSESLPLLRLALTGTAREWPPPVRLAQPPSPSAPSSHE